MSKEENMNSIKLSVEIKDDKLYFSYKVGMSEAEGTAPLTFTMFFMWAEMLQKLNSGFANEHENFREEITAKVWMEKNTDEAKEFMVELSKEKAKEE